MSHREPLPWIEDAAPDEAAAEVRWDGTCVADELGLVADDSDWFRPGPTASAKNLAGPGSPDHSSEERTQC